MVFRLGSNTSVNRELLLSSKDFYSSQDIFLEKKLLISPQITMYRQLLFLPLNVAVLEGIYTHCESTCVLRASWVLYVLKILSAVTGTDTSWSRRFKETDTEPNHHCFLASSFLRMVFLLYPCCAHHLNWERIRHYVWIRNLKGRRHKSAPTKEKENISPGTANKALGLNYFP